MKPLTLAEVNAVMGPGYPGGALYRSAEEPFRGGLCRTLSARGLCAPIYGNAEPGFVEVDAFNERYKGAPVAFVIERVNRILAEIGDES